MNEEVKKLIKSIDTYNDSDDGVYYVRDGSGWLVEKSDFDRVVEALTKWNKVEDGLPEIGVEVLCQNDIWIDDEYNPMGIRIGFLDDICWTTAKWCNLHDEYHTRLSNEDDEQFSDYRAINQVPYKWRYIY